VVRVKNQIANIVVAVRVDFGGAGFATRRNVTGVMK
jgi:hypothetical protein